MPEPHAAPSGQVELGEILDELDPLGRALFDAAFARAQVKQLQRQLAEALTSGAAAS